MTSLLNDLKNLFPEDQSSCLFSKNADMNKGSAKKKIKRLKSLNTATNFKNN